MTVKELTAIGVFVASIISGWLFMDGRHDPNGAAEKAELDSKIFTLNVEVARLTGVKSLYDAREQVEGSLTATDNARRAQIILDIQNIQNQAQNLSNQRAALD